MYNFHARYADLVSSICRLIVAIVLMEKLCFSQEKRVENSNFCHAHRGESFSVIWAGQTLTPYRPAQAFINCPQSVINLFLAEFPSQPRLG